MVKTQIGTYRLKEEKVFRNTFECAAWYEDVLVKAGDYPIYVYDIQTLDDDEICARGVNGVYVDMPGTIVSDYFAGRFGGVQIGDYDSTQNAGKPSNHTLFSYMVFVAKSILDDADSPWKLNEWFAAREIMYTFKDQAKTTYGIFRI